jgi:hypothetical protein
VRRELRKHRSALLLLAVFASVLVFFAAGYSVPYGVSDDYTFLEFRLEHPGVAGFAEDLGRFIQNGRTVLGLLLQSGFAAAGDVESLRYLRFLSVLSLALLAAFTCRLLMLLRWSSAQAAVLAIGVVTLPGFVVFAGWAAAWPFPWAALITGCAALRLLRSIRFSSGESSLRECFWAFVLLSLAFAIHQATAAMFWFFVAAIWLNVTRKPDVMNRFLCACLATFLSAAAVNFATMRIPVLLGLIPFGRRTLLTLHPSEKLTWFLQWPLMDATNLWNILPVHWLSYLVLAVIAVGLVTPYWDRRYWTAWHVLVSIAILPLCYTASLVVNENWPSYRTQAALASTLLLYAATAVRSLFRRIRLESKYKYLAGVGAALVALLLLWHAQMTLERYIVVPQMREWVLVASAIKSSYRSNPATIHLVQPASSDLSLAPAVRYDEFGRASLYAPWVPVPFTKLVLHRLGVAFNAMPKITASPTAQAPSPAGAREAQINVEDIFRLERNQR